MNNANGSPRKPRRAKAAPVQPQAQPERHDLAAIVGLLKSGAALTRHDIELQSGLGRAAVAERLAALLDCGLIEEGELGQTSGGRAPRLVRLRRMAGLVMVAVLGQSTLGVGIADLSGRLLFEHHEATDHNYGPAAIAGRLITLFDWALEQQNSERRDVWSIALAAPGPVEAQEGNAFATPRLHDMLAPDGFLLVEQLMVQYQASICLRSRIQMMTLGEYRAGTGAGAKNLLVIDMGREINAGIISNGKLHLGAQGAAGMIGHISTGEEHTTICRCGNTGCLEVLVGSDAIASEGLRAAREGRSSYLAATLRDNGKVAATDVLLAAQYGDSFSAELLWRCGRLVGTTLAALVNSLNPSVIVLTGTVAQTGDILLASVREAVYRRSHALVTRDLRIVRSQMGSSASLLGAALVAVDELFEPDFLGSWVAAGSPLQHPDLLAALASAERTIQAAQSQPQPPKEISELIDGAQS